MADQEGSDFYAEDDGKNYKKIKPLLVRHLQRNRLQNSECIFRISSSVIFLSDYFRMLIAQVFWFNYFSKNA